MANANTHPSDQRAGERHSDPPDTP